MQPPRQGYLTPVKIRLLERSCEGFTLITVRIESPAFTEREMRAFLDEAVDYERRRLADRLEADSARLGKLAPTLTLPQRGSEPSEGWSAQEILAHIAVLSKFYGTVIYRVGSGKLSQIELLEAVQSRDPAGEQLSSLPPDQLLAMAQRDHQRPSPISSRPTPPRCNAGRSCTRAFR